MENISSDWIVDDTPRSRLMYGSAGAIIEDAIGVMNVTRETRPVASHLLLKDHRFGLLGSFSPSQVIYRNKLFRIRDSSSVDTHQIWVGGLLFSLFRLLIGFNIW